MLAIPHVLVSILWLVIFILFLGLLAWAVQWTIAKLGLPEPVRTVALVIIGIIFLIYLLSLLTGSMPLVLHT